MMEPMSQVYTIVRRVTTCTTQYRALAISGLKLVFSYDVELTLVTMKHYKLKETRLSEFSVRSVKQHLSRQMLTGENCQLVS